MPFRLKPKHRPHGSRLRLRCVDEYL
uniref:Uncharacterized protein n=1 Tax=Rhizophora mucronata TaxID=61149 RepID=A0A2P2QHQ9_RHIMU